MLRSLAAAAALAATPGARAQVPSLAEASGCATEAILVNSVCCDAADAGNCVGGAVPTTCLSETCAHTYIHFYHTCSSIIQQIDVQLPEGANFGALYSSCVLTLGDTEEVVDDAGRMELEVVDDSVAATRLYTFDAPDSTVRGWDVTVDGVMGGRSHGTFGSGTSSTGMPEESCGGALFSGTIELTHGGFVNVRGPTLSRGSMAEADGLRICSKSLVDYGVHDGSGDLYKIVLRESGSQTYWQADFNTLEAGWVPPATAEDGCDGSVATVPFAQFWPTHWGRILGQPGTIDKSKISSIGMDVSFQKQDGSDNPELDHGACASGSSSCQNLNPFSLCVSWIDTYVRRTIIAGIWAAFFQACQQQ